MDVGTGGVWLAFRSAWKRVQRRCRKHGQHWSGSSQPQLVICRQMGTWRLWQGRGRCERGCRGRTPGTCGYLSVRDDGVFKARQLENQPQVSPDQELRKETWCVGFGGGGWGRRDNSSSHLLDLKHLWEIQIGGGMGPKRKDLGSGCTQGGKVMKGREKRPKGVLGIFTAPCT